MNAFIYAADIYCECCGQAIRDTITREGRAPENPDNESSYDSDQFPKGPYANGGGEADSPQHCASCRAFLENPLTDDGREYVRAAIADARPCIGAEVDSPVEQWRAFYAGDMAEAA